MADVIDFNEKAAHVEARDLVTEVVKEVYREITTGKAAKTDQEYYKKEMFRIIDKYNLTDEQIEEILKKVTNGELVSKVLSELQKKKR